MVKRKKGKKDSIVRSKIFVISIVVFCVVLALGVYFWYNSDLSDEVELEENSDGNIAYAPAGYGSSPRMLSRGGGAGSACTSHSNCRSGHCNTNGICA